MQTSAEFTIDLAPGDPVLDGAGRFDFAKTWTGGLSGTSRGVMLTAGDPTTGTAGYVALETFQGSLDGREGSFAIQQFGTMEDGEQVLHYEIVPGSGHGALAGLTGTVDLTITEGRHDVAVSYVLP